MSCDTPHVTPSVCRAVVDFIAGCFGGTACVLSGQPMDTVKVRKFDFLNFIF